MRRSAALLERLSGNHERGETGFHIRGAEAKNFTVANCAFEITVGLQLAAKHPVFFRSGIARIHVPVDHQRNTIPAALDDADGVDPVGVRSAVARL